MKNRLMTIAGAIAISLTVTQTSQAAPITGNIGFSGSFQLNSGSVATATTAIHWFGMAVTLGNTTSGSFTNVPGGTSVTLASPWSFTSGPIANFWSVGGFTFNLTSSSYSVVGSGPFHFLNASFTGTVSAAGFDTTPCSGTLGTQDPPANGITTFTCVLSFNAQPPPPNLIIVTNGPSSLKIVWPNWATYTLQQNTDLASTNWVTSSYAITNGFGTNFCTITPTNGNLFFRLMQ